MSVLARRAVVVGVVTLALVASAATAAHAVGEVTVKSGRWHGMKWEFKAEAADGEFCVAMTVGRGAEDGRSCGSIREDGISYLAHTGRPAPNYVIGPVIAKARSVQIRFLDRPALRISTIAPPPTLDRGTRFSRRYWPAQRRREASLRAMPRDGSSLRSSSRSRASRCRRPAKSAGGQSDPQRLSHATARLCHGCPT